MSRSALISSFAYGVFSPSLKYAIAALDLYIADEINPVAVPSRLAFGDDGASVTSIKFVNTRRGIVVRLIGVLGAGDRNGNPVVSEPCSVALRNSGIAVRGRAEDIDEDSNTSAVAITNTVSLI